MACARVLGLPVQGRDEGVCVCGGGHMTRRTGKNVVREFDMSETM